MFVLNYSALMQIMGDYPLRSKTNTTREDTIYECVVTIIKACFEHPVLIDEVYCYVIKQVTNNRSTKRYGIRYWLMITCKGERVGKYVVTIIKTCFEHPILINEICCHVIKQVTNNSRTKRYGMFDYHIGVYQAASSIAVIFLFSTNGSWKRFPLRLLARLPLESLHPDAFQTSIISVLHPSRMHTIAS